MQRSFLSRASIPNWRTLVSSRDIRRRDKREEDRRRRQLEKLPCPALHWAPVNAKATLSDHWFQECWYSDGLDDVKKLLASEHSSRDFFLRIDHRICGNEKGTHPPEGDYRLMTRAQWNSSKERTLALRYLRKHRILPEYFPMVRNNTNFSVTHIGDNITCSNFWLSPHFGNIVDIKDLQNEPKIFLPHDEEYYCLYVISPDYPYRSSSNNGFLLHGLYCNLHGQSIEFPCNNASNIVVPYTPPLPTEYAGAYRFLYILYRQKRFIGLSNQGLIWNLKRRKNFMNLKHDSLRHVEECLDSYPSAIRFLQTLWDIQVADYYLKNQIVEPCYIPKDTYAEVLSYSQPMALEDEVLSRMDLHGARTETKANNQSYLPAAHHFTVPYLSPRTRAPEQGLEWPNPLSAP